VSTTVTFKTVIRSNSLDTTCFAAGKHFDHIKVQKLQDVPPAELFHQKITIDDSTHEKAELKKRMTTHMDAVRKDGAGLLAIVIVLQQAELLNFQCCHPRPQKA
jgi:hypothetical protein